MRMKRGDKKGLSGIVTALILIVLVLVAAGIVWAVYNSLIKGSAEDIEFSSKCLGVSLDVTSLSCVKEEVLPATDPKKYLSSCTVKVERSIGSNEEFDGVEVEFNDGATKMTTTSTENIAVKGALTATTTEEGVIEANVFQAKEVQIRVYFNKDDLTKYYCSPAIVYEKP